MRIKRGKTKEHSHYEQTGEKIRVLYTDGTWDIRDDENKSKGNLRLWLIHHCPTSKGLEIQRYEGIIHMPCTFCNERCPIALEGLFNMVTLL